MAIAMRCRCAAVFRPLHRRADGVRALLAALVFGLAGCAEEGDTIIFAADLNSVDPVGPGAEEPTAVACDQVAPGVHIGAVALKGTNAVLCQQIPSDGPPPDPTIVASVNDPDQIVLADVSGDGIPDAIVLGDTGQLGIHRLDPFTNQFLALGIVDTLTGNLQFPHIVAGRFNSDAAADIVIVAVDSSMPSPEMPCAILVYLNNGTGSFAPPVITTISDIDGFNGPGAFFATGINSNNDALQDIAICPEVGQEMAVLESDGDGGFDPPEFVGAPSVAHDIRAGDVTGDDIEDIVIAAASNEGDPEVWVIPGLPGGAYDKPIVLPLDGIDDLGRAFLFDLDGDGASEPFITRTTRFEYFPSLGAGAFDTVRTIHGGALITGLAALDKDGDSKIEVVFAVDPIENTAQTFHRSTDPADPFLLFGESRFPFAGGVRVAVGDLDGDGDDDVLTTNGNSIVPLLSAPSGQPGVFSFASGASMLLSQPPLGLDTGGPGSQPGHYDKIALAALTDSTVQVTFSLETPPANVFDHFANGAGDIRIVDFNNDGFPDFCIQSASDIVAVLINQNDGSFDPAPISGKLPAAAGVLGSIDVGDINGDNFPDIAYSRGDSLDAHVLTNSGGVSFAFAESVTATNGLQITQAVALADLNADGRADLVTSSYNSYGGSNPPARVFVHLAQPPGQARGTSLFQSPPIEIDAGPRPSALAIEDMDGDGNPDILVTNRSPTFGQANTVTIMRNLGGAMFEHTGQSARTGGDAAAVAVAQLDNAFGPEVVVANHASFAGAFVGLSVLTSIHAAPAECLGDADGNLMVNFADILAVLANWAADYGPGTGPGDADGNGVVSFADILTVLASYGLICP